MSLQNPETSDRIASLDQRSPKRTFDQGSILGCLKLGKSNIESSYSPSPWTDSGRKDLYCSSDKTPYIKRPLRTAAIGTFKRAIQNLEADGHSLVLDTNKHQHASPPSKKNHYQNKRISDTRYGSKRSPSDFNKKEYINSSNVQKEQSSRQRQQLEGSKNSVLPKSWE